MPNKLEREARERKGGSQPNCARNSSPILLIVNYWLYFNKFISVCVSVCVYTVYNIISLHFVAGFPRFHCIN